VPDAYNLQTLKPPRGTLGTIHERRLSRRVIDFWQVSRRVASLMYGKSCKKVQLSRRVRLCAKPKTTTLPEVDRQLDCAVWSRERNAHFHSSTAFMNSESVTLPRATLSKFMYCPTWSVVSRRVATLRETSLQTDSPGESSVYVWCLKGTMVLKVSRITGF